MTVIGPDRKGLVAALAKIVAAHEGNWLESRMCRLGGEFAGIVRVAVPAPKQAALEAELGKIEGLTVIVRPDEPAIVADQSILVKLEVVGQDRPGIVREITTAIRGEGGNVEELATECLSAPMSGEMLFQARAKIRVPETLALEALRRTLETNLPGLTVEVGRLDG